MMKKIVSKAQILKGQQITQEMLSLFNSLDQFMDVKVTQDVNVPLSNLANNIIKVVNDGLHLDSNQNTKLTRHIATQLLDKLFYIKKTTLDSQNAQVGVSLNDFRSAVLGKLDIQPLLEIVSTPGGLSDQTPDTVTATLSIVEQLLSMDPSYKAAFIKNENLAGILNNIAVFKHPKDSFVFLNKTLALLFSALDSEKGAIDEAFAKVCFESGVLEFLRIALDPERFGQKALPKAELEQLGNVQLLVTAVTKKLLALDGSKHDVMLGGKGLFVELFGSIALANNDDRIFETLGVLNSMKYVLKSSRGHQAVVENNESDFLSKYQESIERVESRLTDKTRPLSPRAEKSLRTLVSNSTKFIEKRDRALQSAAASSRPSGSSHRQSSAGRGSDVVYVGDPSGLVHLGDLVVRAGIEVGKSVHSSQIQSSIVESGQSAASGLIDLSQQGVEVVPNGAGQLVQNGLDVVNHASELGKQVVPDVDVNDVADVVGQGASEVVDVVDQEAQPVLDALGHLNGEGPVPQVMIDGAQNVVGAAADVGEQLQNIVVRAEQAAGNAQGFCSDFTRQIEDCFSGLGDAIGKCFGGMKDAVPDCEAPCSEQEAVSCLKDVFCCLEEIVCCIPKCIGAVCEGIGECCCSGGGGDCGGCDCGGC